MNMKTLHQKCIRSQIIKEKYIFPTYFSQKLIQDSCSFATNIEILEV